MIDIEEVVADNGSMMRVWRYADAPELLKGLVLNSDCCDLVVAVPSEKLGILVDTSFMDWMFGDYIVPEVHDLGEWVIYFVFH